MRDHSGRVVGAVTHAEVRDGHLHVTMDVEGRTFEAEIPPRPGDVFASDATVRTHGRVLSDADVADLISKVVHLEEGHPRGVEEVPLPGDPPPPESLYPRPGVSDRHAGLACPSCGSVTCGHLVRVLAEVEPPCPACGKTAEECGRFVTVVVDEDGRSSVVHLDEDPGEGEPPC